jgi:hypothetical protein
MFSILPAAVQFFLDFTLCILVGVVLLLLLVGRKRKEEKITKLSKVFACKGQQPSKGHGASTNFCFFLSLLFFYFIFLLWGYHLIFAHPTWAENVILF